MYIAVDPRGDHATPAITSDGTANSRRRWRRARAAVSTEPAAIELTQANRRPGTPGFARWTAAVGHHIAAHGLAGAASEVDDLVGVARRFGVWSVAVDVLADSSQPEAARTRAFAHVVSALVDVPPMITR